MQSTTSKTSGLLCLLVATVVSGAVIPSLQAHNVKSVLDRRQAGNAYRIVVYENAQCTGQQIAYSGDATSCTDGLGSGGAGLQLLALDPDGQLVFYDQLGCPPGAEVAVFNPDEDQTGTDCKPLAGNPVSFMYEDV